VATLEISWYARRVVVSLENDESQGLVKHVLDYTNWLLCRSGSRWMIVLHCRAVFRLLCFLQTPLLCMTSQTCVNCAPTTSSSTRRRPIIQLSRHQLRYICREVNGTHPQGPSKVVTELAVNI